MARYYKKKIALPPQAVEPGSEEEQANDYYYHSSRPNNSYSRPDNQHSRTDNHDLRKERILPLFQIKDITVEDIEEISALITIDGLPPALAAARLGISPEELRSFLLENPEYSRAISLSELNRLGNLHLMAINGFKYSATATMADRLLFADNLVADMPTQLLNTAISSSLSGEANKMTFELVKAEDKEDLGVDSDGKEIKREENVENWGHSTKNPSLIPNKGGGFQ